MPLFNNKNMGCLKSELLFAMVVTGSYTFGKKWHWELSILPYLGKIHFSEKN